MAPNAHETRPSPLRTLAALVAVALWCGLLVLVTRLPPDGRDHGDVGQFVGRLHPLLVHGPVALLVLVPAMELAGLHRDWAHLRTAAGWILAVAAAATFAAAFDGWLLALSGGYRGRDVTRHLWGGVMLAAVCAGALRARFWAAPALRAPPTPSSSPPRSGSWSGRPTEGARSPTATAT